MNRLIRTIERAGLAIGGICVLLIMVLISMDALGRYLLGAPISWVVDVVANYLMVVAIYFAVSDTFTRGDHIHLDLFQARMSPRLRAATGIFHSLLAALVFALIAAGNTQYLLEAWHSREFVPGYIFWPVWPTYVPIVLGSALLAVRLLHHVVTLLLKGEDPAVSLEGEDLE